MEGKYKGSAIEAQVERTLVTETDESVDAGFFTQEELSDLHGFYREALADEAAFAGQAILK